MRLFVVWRTTRGDRTQLGASLVYRSEQRCGESAHCLSLRDGSGDVRRPQCEPVCRPHSHARKGTQTRTRHKPQTHRDYTKKTCHTYKTCKTYTKTKTYETCKTDITHKTCKRARQTRQTRHSRYSRRTSQHKLKTHVTLHARVLQHSLDRPLPFVAQALSRVWCVFSCSSIRVAPT